MSATRSSLLVPGMLLMMCIMGCGGGGSSAGANVQLPDLGIKSGSGLLLSAPSDTRYLQGSQIQFSFVVTNAGPGSAPASQAKVAMRNFSNTRTDLALLSVPAIAAGGETTVTGSGTIPSSQALGVYDLIFSADTLNTVAEVDENNNAGTMFGAFSVI